MVSQQWLDFTEDIHKLRKYTLHYQANTAILINKVFLIKGQERFPKLERLISDEHESLHKTCKYEIFISDPSDDPITGVKDSSFHELSRIDPALIYLLKVNNRNTRTKCEICSKLTIKTPERCHWRVVLVFLLLTLNIFHTLF